MKSPLQKLLLIFFLVMISSGVSFSQHEEEENEEMPEFMEMRKPDFHKIQKRANRYFKRKKFREKDDGFSRDSFASENVMGGREEDNEYHRYKRWEWFWRDRVNPDGSFPDPLKSFEVYKQMQGHIKRSKNATAQWTSIGMKTNSGGYWGLGQARSVAVFPGNPSIYYVTTVGGGVWKTTNGGTSYTPIGDGLPQLFCGTVLVDNQNANIVYVNIGGTGEWWLPGLGVYKSSDGGLTWAATGLTGSRANGINVKKMAMSPSNSQIILAATNKGLYRTINGGTNWTVVRTGEHGDVVFRPGDGNTIYAASDDYYNGSEILRSVDGGATWTKVTSLGKTKTRIWIGVSASDKEFVAAVFKTDGSTKDLYVSNDRGNSFSYKSNTMPDADIFYVSQLDKNVMYGAAVTMKQSRDGGNTWTEITNWCCGNDAVRTEVHADFHGATHNPSNLAELVFCNDGGVYKFNESTKKWTDLSNGLVITMYYRIASAQTNNLMVSGATQDNGGNARLANGNWRNTSGGDATMCIIDPTNENIQYSSYINGDGIVKTTNAWNNTIALTDALRKAGAVGGDWATPFAIDLTNPLNLVAGYQDVLRSTNRGDSWTKISNNLTGGANLQHITIAPNDSKTIYTSNGSNFYRTFDTGANWTKKASPAGDITRITVSPTDAKTVYITTNGGNGKRVFKSINGGDSWTNITLNFPNDVNAICIAYEKGTNEGLYVGSPIGVFYKNASLSQWIYHGQGLPNTEVNDISIAYGAKKVRAGTWGRGVWECDLYSDVKVYREPENPLNLVSGLNFDYYQKGYDMLPDFSQETPLWKGGVIGAFNTSFTHTPDSFAVKYYGYIDVPADGEYTFYTNSDDGTKLYIGNQLIVVNDGIHGMTEQSGSILLKKGKHAISLEYFERSNGDGLEVSYSGPGISKQIIPSNVLYMPSLRDPENPAGFAVNGLDYKYYIGSYTTLPDFNSLVVNKSGRINQFDLSIPQRATSNLAVKYMGYIDIPIDGIYTFYSSSDDGSKLYIGNTSIITNDGIHGMVEVQGSIGLKKGKHAITLEYFQGTGGIGLEVSYSGPMLTKRIIPASSLYRIVPLRTPENPVSVMNGVNYNLYPDYVGNVIPDFTTLGNPSKTDRLNQINLNIGGLPADHYAIRYTGFIEVPEDGEYTFYISSDDGSRFFIGNTMVANNDGLHVTTEQSGYIGLKKGVHEFTLEYFEYDYGQIVTVSYESSRITKTVIPPSALYADAIITSLAKLNRNENIEVFPSPFTDKLNVKSQDQIQSVKLVTNDGKTVEDTTVISSPFQYSISVPEELPSGVYFVQVEINEELNTIKVLKK